MSGGNIPTLVMRFKAILDVGCVTDVPRACNFTFKNIDKMHSERV